MIVALYLQLLYQLCSGALGDFGDMWLDSLIRGC